MMILGLDTSGPVCSAALMKDDVLVSEIVINTGLTHSETLMPAVERVMETAGASVSEIDLIAVVAGPGSFTGVRIGVCAARALAHALNRPVCRINALYALAAGAAFAGGVVCPILDARRSQVYTAAFVNSDENLPEQILPDGAMPLTELMDKLPKDKAIYFTGDGVAVHMETIKNILGARAHFAPAHARVLRASSACHLAMMQPENRMPANEVTPIYLRAPQAERERSERLTRAKV